MIKVPEIITEEQLEAVDAKTDQSLRALFRSVPEWSPPPVVAKPLNKRTIELAKELEALERIRTGKNIDPPDFEAAVAQTVHAVVTRLNTTDFVKECAIGLNAIPEDWIQPVVHEVLAQIAAKLKPES